MKFRWSLFQLVIFTFTVFSTESQNGVLPSLDYDTTTAFSDDSGTTAITDATSDVTTTVPSITTTSTIPSEATGPSSVQDNSTEAITTFAPIIPNHDATVSIWALIAIGVLITIAGILTLVTVMRHCTKRRRENDRRRLLGAVSQEGFFVGNQHERYDQAL